MTEQKNTHSLPQVFDLRDESEALYELLKPLGDADFATPTLFKNWTVNDILEHLHLWNVAALNSFQDEAAFDAYLQEILPYVMKGRIKDYERICIDGLAGHALLEAWRDFYLKMTDIFKDVDPKHRVRWAGPDMSIRSSITARLMETWAHGQAIYDLLGVERQHTDRIENIVVLGVNTFNWTYASRQATPPGPMPYVRLTAPSGAIWAYGEENEQSRIDGTAADFCQVVTQVRNVGDTALKMTGAVAQDWMATAQCFAGPSETPPATGQRHLQKA